jgi:hypothetical protein
MKNTLTYGQIITDKFGKETKLMYLDEAGYKGKGMRYIKVQCTSCKKEYIKQYASIKAGYISSCGQKSCKISNSFLHKISYVSGQSIPNTSYRYIEEDIERSTSNHRYFKVQCSCNTIISIRTDNLKGMCRKCTNKKRRESLTQKNKESLIKSILNSYKRNALARGYNFELSDTAFTNLIFSNCYYCGVKPENKITRGNKSMYYNGIDRKINDLNYTEDNSVSCCGKCNVMKNKWSHDDFVSHITKIINNLNIQKNAPL